MDIPTKKTRSYSINNKYQRGYLFRTGGNKGKNSSPRMGWYRASITVGIFNVSWPFITRWSKEGQVEWWIKLQKMRAFKEKDNNKVLCFISKKSLLFILKVLMPTIDSHIHLLRISNINQTCFRTCQDKWIYQLKYKYWRTVSNAKYTKSYATIARMVNQNTVEGHMQKNKL